MTNSKQASLPPLSAWQTAALRFTAFCALDPKIDPSQWWTNLVGYPPETVLSRPKSSRHQVEGVFEDKKLSLVLQPERIDWNLSPLVQPSEQPLELMPLVGPFPDVLSAFVKLMLQWLPVSPPTTRLAFGAILVQPVDDRRTGYTQIAKYLPCVMVDPDGSSDFSYQINRRRDSTSGISRLQINRLTKWSVMLFETFGISLGKTELTKVGYTAQQSACRLELDINTTSEFTGELPPEGLPKIFQELVALGEEIAAKGDIP